MAFEDAIAALAPTIYYPGRVQGNQLLPYGAGAPGSLLGDANALGGALWADSGAPGLQLGTTGEINTGLSVFPTLDSTHDFTIGCSFRTTATGEVCLFSDQTCTHKMYYVFLVNGVLQLGAGNANVFPGPSLTNFDIWNDTGGPTYNDGVSHLITYRHEGATNRHRVDVDGVTRIDQTTAKVQQYSEPGENHYLGDFSECARLKAVAPGQVGHWFAIGSQLTAPDLATTVASTGGATTGTTALFPSMTDLESKLDRIIRSVTKAF